MNRKETYQAWKNGRKDVDVDDSFVDRVMRQVLASEQRQTGDVRSADRADQDNSRRTWEIPTMAALLLLSLTVGLLRYGSVIVFLLLMSSTGN